MTTFRESGPEGGPSWFELATETAKAAGFWTGGIVALVYVSRGGDAFTLWRDLSELFQDLAAWCCS